MDDSGGVQAPNSDTGMKTDSGPAEVVQEDKAPKKKLRLLIPLIVFGVILLAGGAAAYVFVVQKTSEEKFATALSNTGDAIEDILTKERTDSGVTVNGRFAITSPIVADGSVNGSWYESNGTLQGQLNLLGAQVNAEVRAIVPENALAPDVYINIDGLGSVAGLLGIVGTDAPSGISPLLEALDGKWYVINHTLIESPVASEDTSQFDLSQEEIQEITNQALEPLNERLFSMDPEKAVFRINEVYGDEQYEGDDTIKMNVGINRDNFLAFVRAYESVIENTKLKDFIETASPGSSIDELLPFEDFENDLDSFQDIDLENGSADVWVESNGRFIRNIRFYPVQDNRDENYIDFSLPYKGRDVFPLEMKVRMNQDGSNGTLLFGLNYNQSNGDSSLQFDVNIESDNGLIAANGNLEIANSNNPVEVTVPDGATNILEVLEQALNPFSSTLEAQLPEGFDASDFNSLDDIEIPIETLNL